MRGIVNRDINERSQPGVNAHVLSSYKSGDVVNVKSSVFGDSCDGEDIWYKLDNGAYLWSGGVNVQNDCSALNEVDREQFLISYRKVNPVDGRPDLSSKEPPNDLYFATLKLPADSESVRVNALLPEVFAQGVLDSIKKLNDSRKHVFIYIHGYQLFSSLKLDLLGGFVMNYMTSQNNGIAKVVFMAWPGQGGPSRETVDDRSIRAGQQFTANNLFRYFEVLSQKLRENEMFLNLIVHSFGHQLLNGMLNPEPTHQNKVPAQRIFKNIFLMAPDITHLVVKRDPTMSGVNLRNYFQDANGKDYHYDFSALPGMADRVHVFYDKYDYLLYSSTKKFVEKSDLKNAKTRADRLAITSNYRELGNYGNVTGTPIDNASNNRTLQLGFNYIDVQQLIANAPPVDLLDFPFQNIRNGPGKCVDDVWSCEDYSGINSTRIIFNASRFPNHHRYLFTCKSVVDEVLRLL